MKKNCILFALAAILAAGCSKEFPDAQKLSDEVRPVTFTLEARPDTDFSLQPMTRATADKCWMKNEIRILILKKDGSRWIVDTTRSVNLDATLSPFTELKVAELPQCSFGFEMLPGDYRMVAAINWQSCKWNNLLVPGTVVADEEDPSFRTPPLMTYLISDHFMNRGLRMLNREVLVAVADFNVSKQGDLHSGGNAAVNLVAERRVAKFRVLLNAKPSEKMGFNFERTPHYVYITFEAADKPLPEGIDALGAAYYGDEPIRQLDWSLSTDGYFYLSGDAKYQMCRPMSTVFSPFLFADPEQGELPVKITKLHINSNDIGPMYDYNTVSERGLTPSKITGIVLQTTDNYEFDFNTNKLKIEVVEAADGQGLPENPAAIFDCFSEWNAKSI